MMVKCEMLGCNRRATESVFKRETGLMCAVCKKHRKTVNTMIMLKGKPIQKSIPRVEKKDSLLEKICRFKKIEAEAAKKARKFEQGVGIDPDTYIAKEILYQTAELKFIRQEILEIKKIIKNSQTNV